MIHFSTNQDASLTQKRMKYQTQTFIRTSEEVFKRVNIIIVRRWCQLRKRMERLECMQISSSKLSNSSKYKTSKYIVFLEFALIFGNSQNIFQLWLNNYTIKLQNLLNLNLEKNNLKSKLIDAVLSIYNPKDEKRN